jgi:hypothetical protein
MLPTWLFTLLIISFIFVAIMGVTLYTSYSKAKKLAGTIYARGANGVAGQNINMTCPAGTTILLKDATLICNSTTQYIDDVGGGSCDPFSNPTSGSSYNNNNVVNYATKLGNLCNGKNSYSFTVPSSTDVDVESICNGSACGTNGQIQLISTYLCEPSS